MKSWGDLSWREKCKIRDGDVSDFKYLSGYSFDVKAKVRDGKEKKSKNDRKNDKS